MDILKAMARVMIIPKNVELTTVQAADVLDVSLSFLIEFLDAKKIPHRKVGKHRRILAEDVMAYNASAAAERETAFNQLVADAQEQDMGYSQP